MIVSRSETRNIVRGDGIQNNLMFGIINWVLGLEILIRSVGDCLVGDV